MAENTTANKPPDATDDTNQETMMPLPANCELENMTEEQKAKERWTILKNIILISLGWVMVMSAWGGLSRLQSSLNRDDGMGTVTISVLHAALMTSSLLLPKPVLHLVGHKYTMIIGLFTYILWAAANGYAVWATMVPVSIIVGLAAAPMWTAQQTYFTLLAGRYAKLSNEEHHTVVSKFIGVQFGFGFLGGISGSIISATVLRQPKNNISEEALGFCGMNDCPWVNVSNPNTLKPPQSTVWTMLIIYVAIAVVGLLIFIVFVDELPRWLLPKEGNLRREVVKFLTGTARQMKNKKQLALIPITVYTGLEQGALGAEFTKSYVTCSIGIWQIGHVMIPYGIIHGLMSFALGYIVKHTGRKALFSVGFALDFIIQMTMIFWRPNPEEGYVLYIIAIFWAVTDSIWQNQIPSMYAITFKDITSAFATHGLWSAFGWVVAFGYSSYLCTSVKLYILISWLFISALGYTAAEILCSRDNKINYGQMH